MSVKNPCLYEKAAAMPCLMMPFNKGKHIDGGAPFGKGIVHEGVTVHRKALGCSAGKQLFYI